MILLGLPFFVYANTGIADVLKCSDFGETDSDNDGYAINASICAPSDCNDNNSLVYPSASEICGDGVDQNCDGHDTSCGGTGGTTTSSGRSSGGGGGGYMLSTIQTTLTAHTGNKISGYTDQDIRVPIRLVYNGTTAGTPRKIQNVLISVDGLPYGSYQIIDPETKEIPYLSNGIWTLLINSPKPVSGEVSVSISADEFITNKISKKIYSTTEFFAEIVDKDHPKQVSPVEQEPTLIPSIKKCDLFNINLGAFIVCWYWWILIFLLLLIIILYFLTKDIEREYRPENQRHLKFYYWIIIIIMLLTPAVTVFFVQSPINFAAGVFLEFFVLIYFTYDYIQLIANKPEFEGSEVSLIAVDYVKNAIIAKYTVDSIKTSLRKAGYSEENINKIVSRALDELRIGGNFK